MVERKEEVNFPSLHTENSIFGELLFIYQFISEFKFEILFFSFKIKEIN